MSRSFRNPASPDAPYRPVESIQSSCSWFLRLCGRSDGILLGRGMLIALNFIFGRYSNLLPRFDNVRIAQPRVEFANLCENRIVVCTVFSDADPEERLTRSYARELRILGCRGPHGSWSCVGPIARWL